MLSRLSRTITSAVSTYSYPTTKSLFSTATTASPSVTAYTNRLLNLNDMGTIPGAVKKRRRWGRGIGSNRGKTCGWGHQKSRSTPRGFEGGQTPLYKRLPKIGFHNFNEREFQVLNLDLVEHFIVQGRLTPKPDGLITMRDLLACGIVTQVRDGVKLLAKNCRIMKHKIHLEVSYASYEAIKAVEKAGGTVTCVHFNTLALRALTKPFKFDILPRRARPVPRLMECYLDYTKCGYLSPEIQIRNLKLFGTVTSEEMYREEHDRFMVTKRRILWPEHQPGYNATTHKQVLPKMKDAVSNL